ncbi:GNAT family N-acetyltransferase [Timonella senegalensis]|uniref:GNAT family N-acetyltransferase n=1 Tax=Timonella senegalensis TaxID=1465825 RepID=UPI00031DA1B8|nr:GNAT family protein [Timonella senegalensis]
MSQHASQSSYTEAATEYPQCVPTLVGDGVRLRAHHHGDIARIVEQSSDPDAQRFIPLPHPYTADHARSFIDAMVSEGWVTGRRFEFAIDEVSPDGTARFAGNVGVWPRGDDRWEIGFVLHPDARGHGVMKRAADLALDWIFMDKGAQVVLWCADAENEGSRAAAVRLGFTHQVVLPNWILLNGVYRDLAESTMTRSAWEELRRG